MHSTRALLGVSLVWGAGILCCVAAAAADLGQTSAMADLQTRAERTAYRETSRYDDVMAFLQTVDRSSARVHLTTFGYSYEGRPLPLAVIGGVQDASPETVRQSGRTRVYLQGNIHAGEVEGKEVLQALVRSLAQGEHREWDDRLVLLVAPIYNADGNERVQLTNRGAQNGPIGGAGQRPNAQGFDLNRDHMKLDSPEARSLAFLLQQYDPHVGIDLHTTNGSTHAYELTYAPPLHPGTDPAIVDLLRGEWLPAVTKSVKATTGWDFYYYGNITGRGENRTWATFDHRPRFGNNYLGVRNRFGILSEAYSYSSFERRIASTRTFVEAVLAFAHANADRIREITTKADTVSIVGQTIALRADFERSAAPVEILMGEVERGRHPYTGQPMNRRLDVSRPERMWEAGTFTPTVTERVPSAYLVPASLTAVLDRLRAHGVRVTPLMSDRRMAVEEFRIETNTAAEQAFQNHRERTLTGRWVATGERTIPAGTVLVPMDQALARLAFLLLEPRSDDGLANWNLLDEALEGAAVYPIVRTP